jgi:hypothetical protein
MLLALHMTIFQYSERKRSGGEGKGGEGRRGEESRGEKVYVSKETDRDHIFCCLFL